MKKYMVSFIILLFILKINGQSDIPFPSSAGSNWLMVIIELNFDFDGDRCKDIFVTMKQPVSGGPMGTKYYERIYGIYSYKKSSYILEISPPFSKGNSDPEFSDLDGDGSDELIFFNKIYKFGSLYKKK